MYKIEILNKSKKMIMLKWIGAIKADEIGKANDELELKIKETGYPFKLLVDTEQMKLVGSANEAAFASQQQQFLPRISYLAVVNKSMLNKLQFRNMADRSGNNKENFFGSFDEAVKFLESK